MKRGIAAQFADKGGFSRVEVGPHGPMFGPAAGCTFALCGLVLQLVKATRFL